MIDGGFGFHPSHTWAPTRWSTPLAGSHPPHTSPPDSSVGFDSPRCTGRDRVKNLSQDFMTAVAVLAFLAAAVVPSL